MTRYLYSVIVVVCALTCVATPAWAQDAYHARLRSELSTEYDLPAGDWVFYDTEARNIGSTFRYNVQTGSQPIVNQNFGTEVTVKTARAAPNFYDAGYGLSNATAIRRGDAVLFVFSVRSAGGAGQVAVAIERKSDYAKEFFVTLPVDINWQTYYIAFETGFGPYAPGALNFVFQVGHKEQDIRLGGFTAINYGTSVPLGKLPSDLNADKYGGYEADAAWRAPAAQRIDELRKANLSIVATDADGRSVANVPFRIEQEQHEFAFGTAIKACRIAGNNCRNPIFESKLTNLDGQGHGFNWVVFENDLKWPGWEQEWFVKNADLAKSVQWLRERDIKIRGHNLLWPGFDNLPDDVKAKAGDTAYVLKRIRDHINELANYPGIEGELADWDVINETVTNVTLENAFRGKPGYATGRELYAQVFDEARRAFPDAKLYLNDYITISAGNGPESNPYKALQRNLRELQAAGAALDGIGFQGHIGGRPNGIPSVLDVFDDFYDEFGLEAKITEFDLPPTVSDTLAAKYLGDFLTATFSHPSMTGFFFWNFWDTDTWQNPQANLFDAAWNRTPAGDVFVQKVFTDWWTNADLTSGADGRTSTRAFKGKHVVTYTCGGKTVRDTVTLGADAELKYTCDDFAVGLRETDAKPFRLSPNPSHGSIRVDHELGRAVDASIVNAVGQAVWRGRISASGEQLSLDLAPGTYFMRVGGSGELGVQKVVVQ